MQRNFGDQFAVRALYGQGEHEDDPIDSTTLEFSLLFGGGLASTGGKWYVGAGYFQEEWENQEIDFDETFSGYHLMAGAGYNWSRVALDGWFSVRDDSDYDDFAAADVDRAMAVGITLGGRF